MSSSLTILIDLLRRREALDDFLAYHSFLNAGDELFGDSEVNVGFEQRAPDLTGRLPDVLFVELSPRLEAREDALELLREVGEHTRRVPGNKPVQEGPENLPVKVKVL